MTTVARPKKHQAITVVLMGLLASIGLFAQTIRPDAITFLAQPVEPPTTARRYTVLHTFQGSDGAYPYGNLVRDSGGSLYGTTSNGGTANAGVIYKLETTGKYTVLYTFTGMNGALPNGLIRDSTGNLYGTTEIGGRAGAGVVYEFDTSGQETVLYSFTGGADGAQPYAGVFRDSAGNLYGTTEYGGTSGSYNCPSGCGVVYKLDATGHYTVLHSFTGGVAGGNTQAGVIRDSAGNLYGTTQYGGTVDQGVVYKVDTVGHEAVLHNFTGFPDGSHPHAGVIRDSEGNLYGTTVGGGAEGANAGVVYKLYAENESVLYSFGGNSTLLQPYTGVIRDSAGNLYGTTAYGGDLAECGGFGCGVVYKLDTTGTCTVLHSFTGAGGQYPTALIRDSKGNLYGTAQTGGKNNLGVVFKLAP